MLFDFVLLFSELDSTTMISVQVKNVEILILGHGPCSA